MDADSSGSVERMAAAFVPAAEIRRLLTGCQQCDGAADVLVIMVAEHGGVRYVFGLCTACELDLGTPAGRFA